MGNCLFFAGQSSEAGENIEEGRKIKVITSNGGIMELDSPITVGCIADEFPAGYGIFKTKDLFWNPLPHHQELQPGNSYYLLPTKGDIIMGGRMMMMIRPREGHVRSNSLPSISISHLVPYRMSFDRVLRRSHSHSHSQTQTQAWKVKLAITPKRLLEILEEDDRTQEFIDSVRTVAKCGTTATCFSSSIAFSDHWTFSATATAPNPTPPPFSTFNTT